MNDSNMFETSRETADRVADRLGFNQPSPLDVVNRDDYKSDDAYLDAVAAETIRRSSPEFQRARRQANTAYRQRQEQEQTQKAETAYKEIRSGVELSDRERQEVTRQVQERAQRALRTGELSSTDYANYVQKATNELTEKVLNNRAAGTLFNKMVRGEL